MTTTKTRKYHQEGYLVFNQKDGSIHFCSSLSKVGKMVGSSLSTVQRNLQKDNQFVGSPDFLVKRYNDQSPWATSKEIVGMKPTKRASHRFTQVTCVDTKMRNVTYHESIGHAARAFGLAYKNVYQAVKTNQNNPAKAGSVRGRWVFSWTNPPDAEKGTEDVGGFSIYLKVLPYGLVVHYPTVRSCALATGLDMDTLTKSLLTKEQSTNTTHYLVKNSTDMSEWVA